MQEGIALKIDLFEMRGEMVEMKKQHQEDLVKTKSGVEDTVANLTGEIKRLLQVRQSSAKYAKIELKIKDATIKNLENKLNLFTDNSKKMKAILRVPRLTKQFHDILAEGKLTEFACLSKVYDHHYEAVGTLFSDNEESGSPGS